MTDDNPPEGFLRIDFDRGRPIPIRPSTAMSAISICKRGAKGTRDEFVLGFRVQQHMCNPAGGLHGGMMMTMADLVGTHGRRRAGRPAQVRADRQHDASISWRRPSWATGSRAAASWCASTRSLLFTNIYLTVGEEKILRASAIAKIPSGDGQAFGRARLDRSAEVAAKGPPA